MLESDRSSGAGNLGQGEFLPLQCGNAQTEAISFLFFFFLSLKSWFIITPLDTLDLDIHHELIWSMGNSEADVEGNRTTYVLVRLAQEMGEGELSPELTGGS